MKKPLEGRIALVAGATRGAGRGIATRLGEAGATVYCTGRSTRGRPASGSKRPETIEETAEQVTALGGHGIAIRCDHTVTEEVAALCERIQKEQGRLDILVNDIWGCDNISDFGVPFWKQSPDHARTMLERAVLTHIITSRHAVPLMLEQERGLVVEITDGDHFGYRGSVNYDVVKMSVIRLAFAMSRDLRRTRVTALAVTPGFLRSEEMLENFGVTEATWRDGAKVEPDFIASESPAYVGRAVAALAADPNVATKAGAVHSSWALAREYGFTDLDGSQPHWADHFERTYRAPYSVANAAAYASWHNSPIDIVRPNWPLE
ncbi:SDR family oxidoreductase [Myxococcus qinghaiensis]|uniref:SDR family oxidoreductase n=1 Tax=Myxococcus qinghaiensis TaxID=2906758 RepID=UPI0020A6E5DF|nr:SDR family oxidoreductase [Myxococcus qinghaiensis]MCP3163750.1 SDR family NAD(P)-dependent oxidoreductase [Myxococcus qinghaiensis]